MAAIDHGADAVYIGAERFGARAAAGNSVADIKTLCDYAHRFLAKVYVTVNTIVYDDETDDTLRLIRELGEIGVDAILLQDMGIVQLLREKKRELGKNIPLLHASTQTDNRTPEKVKWLRSQGFSRVVLARELSVDEIAAIHRAVPDAELEVFVHGALCVSYSGVCYASQKCFGRSANRGECAQFCRMKFDLTDSDGKVIERGRHFLSLKDMNRCDGIEAMIEAGAVSLKIEGRLKNVEYVKNVTAAYSEQLNRIIEKSGGKYKRASLGRCRYDFTPDLHKTFNRGFTDYFLDGKRTDIASIDTPKARGEFVGKVKEIRGGSFNVAGTATFANGDGLCFINKDRELEGFRVNKVLNNRLFPLKMPQTLRPGMSLWRNCDVEFERLLARQSGERKIPVAFKLGIGDTGLKLVAMVGERLFAPVSYELHGKEMAQKPQRENIVRQLSKLGNTRYECSGVDISHDVLPVFLPSSVLAEMRRMAVEALDEVLKAGASRRRYVPVGQAAPMPLYPEDYPYLYNVSNRAAQRFYEKQGRRMPVQAFELGGGGSGCMVMQCRYCLRHALGYCTKHGGKRQPWHGSLFLKTSAGKSFRLEFDCKKCQMNVYAED